MPPESDPLTLVEQDEAWRREAFPVVRDKLFLAHAAVAPPPARVTEAMQTYNLAATRGDLDYSRVFLEDMETVRASAARIIGARPTEVSLLGPTSLGLSLVARGIDWRPGDEILCYLDDYPANVYPWQDLEREGVVCRYLQPEAPGEITPSRVKSALTDRTRLVALASCHFLSGYRLQVESIGTLLRERGILFCLDAIQSVGAFPTPAASVDFLCADAHKWMLGPLTAGIFYVREEVREQLHPTLLGAWNVSCPGFIAQESVTFEAGGRRYEPGVLNASALMGMKASLDHLLEIGIDRIANRLLELKAPLAAGLKAQGWQIVGPDGEGESAASASAITSFTHPERSLPALQRRLEQAGVAASPRRGRDGSHYLRFSHHYYNTRTEIERLLALTGP